MNFEILKDQLNNKKNSKLLIGVSGISLSGKTALSNLTYDYLSDQGKKVSIIHLKEEDNLVGQSFEDKNPAKYFYENFINEDNLNEEIESKLKSSDVVIVEGLLLFKNTVKINFDIKVWVDCTFTTSIERGENKELLSDYYMWLQRMHFSIDNPKAKADIIINNDEILEKEEETYVDFKNNPGTIEKMKWFCEPKKYKVSENGLEVYTDAITDFWQRTHYGFRNDNAHMLYINVDGDFKMYTKVKFNAIHQFDQCGLAVRIDEDNWLKTSIEYELNNPPKLGAVVTNLGYSDWSTTELDYEVREAEFKITREGQDYKIEVKLGDRPWAQLRICHIHKDVKSVMCGVYCCSPIDKGYKVVFEDIKIREIFF